MKFKVFLLCLIPLLFGGCWDQQIFEENTIVLSAGIEKSEKGENHYKYTFVSEGGTANEKKLSAINVNSRILSEAIVIADKESSTPLEVGKLQTILFHKPVAEENFNKLIDNHKIEEVNRFLPDYLVTECPPVDIYKAISKMKLGVRSFSYLSGLLKTASESGHCPNIYERDYNIDFLNDNPDPTLPYITAKEKKVEVLGTALFADKKMVGSLSTKESSFLHLVTQGDTKFSYVLNKPGSHGKTPLIFQTNRCNAKVKTKIEDGNVHIYIEEKIVGFYDKLIWARLMEKYNYDSMDKFTTNYFERETIKTILTLQQYGSDPLGIKGKLEAYHPDFAAAVDLDEAYKSAKVTVKANVNIKNNVNPKK